MTEAFRPEGPPPGRGAAVVYLLLVAMGVAALTPCILLPEWRKYQALHMAAQVEEFELAEIRNSVEKQKEMLHAMRRDPGVVARLAQRELNLGIDRARIVRVDPLIVGSNQPRQFVPTPPSLPIGLERAAGWLPRMDYDRIFCDRQIRPYVVGLSLGLILVAFTIFRPRNSTLPTTD